MEKEVFHLRYIDSLILFHEGPLKRSEHVLRPAILQPPRAQRREKVRHNALEHCKTKEKTKNKVRKLCHGRTDLSPSSVH